MKSRIRVKLITVFALVFFLKQTLPGQNSPQPICQPWSTHPISTIPLFAKYMPDDPVIIDAGAYDGAEGAILAREWPKGHIHSFEPVPEIYKMLAETASKTPNMSIYNYALSTIDGKSEMFISEFAAQPGIATHSASLRAPKEHLNYATHVVFPRSIIVETFTIDTWAELNGIDRVDMMWLDMQGVELEVLKASPKILATTRVIIMEVEFVEAYEGQYHYTDIKRWFEEQGFVLIWGNFNVDNPMQDRQWCGDALFVRKSLLGE